MLMDLLNKAVTVAMLVFVVSSIWQWVRGSPSGRSLNRCAMPVWSCLRCWPISS